MIKSYSIKFILVITLIFGQAELFGHDSLDVRSSVTFILGADKEGDNPFYSLAENYYRYNKDDATEEVITHIRSLTEVQSFLINNVSRNGLAWGRVNLVTHGNPYVGLSAKISPDGVRASAESIREALNAGILMDMPVNLFDEYSHIEIHGCGLGQNEALVQALTAVFTSECFTPNLAVSKFFEYYLFDPEKPKEVMQMQADFWTINYKFGYRPTDRGIYNRFKAKYPDESVDWKKAIVHESAKEVGDVFYYTYDVPVKWVLPFASMALVPNLTTKAERLRWIKQQPAFLDFLSDIEIPPENFNWWMRRINVDIEDGTTSPALWVKGHSTFYCVLRLRDSSLN